MNKEARQRAANDANKKLYVYELENKNQVSSFEPLPPTQKVGGSKIAKLLEVIKPEKSKDENVN